MYIDWTSLELPLDISLGRISSHLTKKEKNYCVFSINVTEGKILQIIQMLALNDHLRNIN